MIAGKTEAEILSMKYTTRHRWYKTILPIEKEEAMKIVNIAGRIKNSIAHIGNITSRETRIKISISTKGKICSKETRAKMSAARTGENNPMYGKIVSEETRVKQSEAKMGEKNSMYGKTHTGKTRSNQSNSAIERWKDSEYRDKHSGENHFMYSKIPSEETRIKQSVAWTSEKRAKQRAINIGKNNPNYIDGRSFLPYCYLFNEKKKEEVRNHWGRICVLTDLMRSTLGSESGFDDFEGHEIFSKQRHSVHHIKGDKMEGCNGKEMALISLQSKFNVKKFDGLRLEDHPFYITLFLLKDVERKHREEMLVIKLEKNT